MTFTKPELVPVAIEITQAGIGRYAEVTGDFNPIHVDPDFAAKTEMGGVIAHGTLSLNLIWQSLEKTLGKALLGQVAIDVAFKRPVRVGDRIEAGGSLRDGEAVYNVWARNQDGVNVIEGTARLTSA